MGKYGGIAPVACGNKSAGIVITSGNPVGLNLDSRLLPHTLLQCSAKGECCTAHNALLRRETVPNLLGCCPNLSVDLARRGGFAG